MNFKLIPTIVEDNDKPTKHPKCKETYDAWNGDYNCGYKSNLMCEDCKYGSGRKDPEAKCNAI